MSVNMSIQDDEYDWAAVYIRSWDAGMQSLKLE